MWPLVSSFEEPLDAEDILCATMATDHPEVNGASVFIHAQDMQITKSDLIDALLTLNDALSQTWIVNSSASFHVTPKDCITAFHASKHGHVYLANNHTCSIESVGTLHLPASGTNELVLHELIVPLS